MSVKTLCRSCEGSGYATNHAHNCPKCHGKGTLMLEDVVDNNVNGGFPHGHSLLFRGLVAMFEVSYY